MSVDSNSESMIKSIDSVSTASGSFLSQGSEINNMSYGSSMSFNSQDMSNLSNQSSFFED